MTSINKTVLLASVQSAAPERCLKLAQNPSTQGYYALKSRLEASSTSWLQRFLDIGGLVALVDTLESLSGRDFTNFADCVLQIDCLGCIRALLNTSDGMQSLLAHDDLVRRMVIALDSSNALPKKQIFEVLTVVVVYSLRGHQSVMEALVHFQKICHQTSEFSLVLRELRETDTPTYKRTLLAFINAILTRHKNLHDRYRLRSQLIGLGLLDILETFRREQQDANLLIQLEVFWDMKCRDEDLIERTHSFDFNDPKELFNALLDEVSPFPDCQRDLLHILQDLYLLHATRNIDQSLLWSTMSQMSHHITNFVDETETQDFLQSMKKINSAVSIRKEANTKRAPLRPITSTENKIKAQINDRDSGISMSANSSFYDNIESTKKSSTKRVNWTKVPKEQAMKPLSIWRQINEASSLNKKAKLNFEAIEQEFICTDSSVLAVDDEVSAKVVRLQDKYDSLWQIQLLPQSVGLKINLFLSRLETSPDALSDCLLEGDDSELTLSALRTLVKLIPCMDTVNQLRKYEGERFDLAPAEQFLLKLSDYVDFRQLLEGLLFRKEFRQSLPRFAQMVGALIASTRDIMHHHGLRDFVRVVLRAGNFLNTGHYTGQALGIKLDSLATIVEVKGQHHHSNLLATIIQQMEVKDETVLMFAQDFNLLEAAADVDMAALRNDVNQLNNKFKKFSSQISSSGQRIKDMFNATIEDAKKDLQLLHDNLTQVKSLASQMAQYFCEDPHFFDLQKCLICVLELCLLVRKYRKEGPRNLQQHQVALSKMAALGTRRQETQQAKVFGHNADACSSFTTSSQESVFDGIVKDIECGKFICQTDFTLEDAENSLQLSQINTSTPHKAFEETMDGDHCSFAICAVRDKTERKTYVDRVEGVIAPQYHRGHQHSSASFVNEVTIGDLKAALAEGEEDETLKAEEDELKIRIYPKMNACIPERRNAWIKKHRRINSDFNHSTRADENWEKYQKEANPRQRESKNVVMSLGLEKEGRVLLADDMEEMEKTLVASDDGHAEGEKPKKRASFGFFKRFNNLRATLTQRNSNFIKKDSKKIKRSKKEKEANKENCISEC